MEVIFNFYVKNYKQASHGVLGFWGLGVKALFKSVEGVPPAKTHKMRGMIAYKKCEDGIPFRSLFCSLA